MVEDGYWDLLNYYGWPGPETGQYYGPLNWTNEERQYSGELKPFFLLSSGRINLSSASGTGVVFGPGLVGQWWSGSAASSAAGPGSIHNGINSNSQHLGIGNVWGRAPAFSLRCLTQ